MKSAIGWMLFWTLAMACSSRTITHITPDCVPGTIQACACDAEMGNQSCKADGSRFEDCVCGDAGAITDAGAD